MPVRKVAPRYVIWQYLQVPDDNITVFKLLGDQVVEYANSLGLDYATPRGGPLTLTYLRRKGIEEVPISRAQYLAMQSLWSSPLISLP